MTSLRIGQKVICINDKRGRTYRKGDAKYMPVKNRIYTIRDHFECIDGIGVRLTEIINPLDESWVEAAYDPSRFRPVKETNIDVFLAMLKTKQKEDAL